MTKEIYQVLLVDDDEEDYIITDEYLKESERVIFELSWVDTYQDGLESILKNEHDVYLLDYRLGKENGLDLLQPVINQGCRQPMILLTGVGDYEIDRQAMVMGASDYLVKGNTMNGALLERAILHAIERKRLEIRQTELIKQLASVNEELKDFAHVISHDLKAPLRGITSLVEWFEKDYGDILDENGQQMLLLMTRRVKVMNKLISGVLQYSRVAKEPKELVNLNTLVPDIIEMISNPQQVKIIIETDLPVVSVGINRIRQVFQNLIDNAIKYIDKPEGEVRLGHISLEQKWQFYVADTGKGIESKHFQSIFQLFETLTPCDREQNTGVGLSIVKKIIELYGGHIWVTSQIGKGSTFHFTLPKKIED